MIFCYPDMTRDSDKPYWVPLDVFEQRFDQDDYLCRDLKHVPDQYLSNWFHEEQDGRRFFILPTVYIISGRTEFISGRHRTAVLSRHLQELPIAFAEGLAQDFAASLGLCPIPMDQPFALPDLREVESRQ